MLLTETGVVWYISGSGEGLKALQYGLLLKSRETLLLWLGQTVSAAGDRLYGLAAMWMALQISHSAAIMAQTSLAESLAFATAGFVAGGWLDRVNLLKSVIAIDILRGMMVLTIPVLACSGHLHIWALVAVGVCMGAFGGAFDPALETLLPRLVPADRLSALVGFMDTPSRFARLLGPGMAGMLLHWVPLAGFFALDAGTFGISVISLFGLRHTPGVTDRTSMHIPRNSLGREMLGGVRIVLQDPHLCTVFIMDVFGNLLFAAYSLGSALLASQQFHAGVSLFGWLIAAYGVGSLLGNFVAGNVKSPRVSEWGALCGWFGIGLGFLLLGRSHHVAGALLSIACAGACGSLAHVSRATLIGTRVQRHEMGKVYSLSGVIGTLCSAGGTLLIGVWLDRWPASRVIVVAGLILMTVNLMALGWESARRLRAVSMRQG